MNGHNDVLRAVAFSPDGTYLAAGSEDTTARLWDVRIG
jgi:WD40 repeat protein